MPVHAPLKWINPAKASSAYRVANLPVILGKPAATLFGISPPYSGNNKGGDITARLSAGLPNITGATFNAYAASDGDSGALYNTNIVDNPKYINVVTSGDQSQRFINFNAQRSNSIYGNSNTVQPPAICLIPQIRY